MKHQKTIEQDVISFIKRNDLIFENQKILIALSGGADSVFALYFFHKYKKKYKISLSAAHINHKLRGKESDSDEEFSRELCDDLGIDFFSSDVDVKGHLKTKKKSIEEAARELRYKELQKISEKINADLIVTAHNNNDNTETILLNLFSGSGVHGLAGIPYKRVNIIRPFLSISKDEIIEYLNNNNINYIYDSSNDNVDFKRNFIRKELLPLIKKELNPSIDQTLLKSSEILKQQSSLIDYFIEEISKDILKFTGNEIIFSIGGLRKYPVDVLGEVLKKIIKTKFSMEFCFSLVSRFRELMATQVGKEINLGNNLVAIRDRDNIVIRKKHNIKKEIKSFKIGTEIKFGDIVISSSFVKHLPIKFLNDGKTEFISGDKIANELSVRQWQMGDRIKLLGMKETKKVSDVLTDSKVPSFKRNEQLVLLNKNDIVWLVGNRISENYKITESTKKVVKLCLS